MAGYHQNRACGYCSTSATAVDIDYLAETIRIALERHYKAQSIFGNVVNSFNTSHKRVKQETVTEAIQNNAKVSVAVARDIQQLLHQRYGTRDDSIIGSWWTRVTSNLFNRSIKFGADDVINRYEPTDEIWQVKWRAFEHSIKTQNRYFSNSGLKLLESIFEDLEKLQTNASYPLITTIGADLPINTLYRARVFQSNEKLASALNWPDAHLGSPPSHAAAGGRMNAKGISVFYGTNDRQTALAEVRPPVGSQVVTGCFKITRKLRVLDLSALKQIETSGSIFDDHFTADKERAAFLFKFSQRMTRPVMPDDESMEYLITQAIADFLSSAPDLNIDGIIFPSVQVAGDVVNVVLFHKAALVEPWDLKLVKDIKVRLGSTNDYGIPASYSVEEIVYKDPPSSATKDISGRPMRDENKTGRVPALQLDVDSLRVHVIKAIRYTEEEFEIKRVRSEEIV